MTDWVRLWHDMPTDPKWRVIAKRAGQPLPCVLAVFTMMLTNASANAAERGTLLAWDHEDAAAALDMDPEAIEAIYQAMQGKVLDGARLSGWERRQPKREDGTAAERKAAWKERKEAERNALERIGTHRNAPETETETETEKQESEVARAARPDPKGSRLPRDWSPGDEHFAFAASEGFPPDIAARIAEQFRDHWHAVAGAKGRKTDWMATWRTWVRREGERGGNGKNGQHGRTGASPAAGQSKRDIRLAAAVEAARRAGSGHGLWDTDSGDGGDPH